VKKGPLRIIASLLLIVTLLTLSGLTATAGTLLTAATAKSCCDSGCDDAPAAGGPCSTPDCPCFSCISMILSPSITVQRNSAGERFSQIPPKRYQLSAYVRSIEYPPENA